MEPCVWSQTQSNWLKTSHQATAFSTLCGPRLETLAWSSLLLTPALILRLTLSWTKTQRTLVSKTPLTGAAFFMYTSQSVVWNV